MGDPTTAENKGIGGTAVGADSGELHQHNTTEEGCFPK